MRRKGYLSARSARWISCLSEKERERERERKSYRKRKSINNYSVWVYFPTQKQIIKILIRMTMIKQCTKTATGCPDSPKNIGQPETPKAPQTLSPDRTFFTNKTTYSPAAGCEI